MASDWYKDLVTFFLVVTVIGIVSAEITEHSSNWNGEEIQTGNDKIKEEIVEENVEDRSEDIVTDEITLSESVLDSSKEEFDEEAQDEGQETVGHSGMNLRQILRQIKADGFHDEEEMDEAELQATDSLEEQQQSQPEEELEEQLVSSADTGEIHNVTEGNVTALNVTNNVTTSKKAVCLEIKEREAITNVEIINGTALTTLLHNNPNVTSRTMPASCVLVYFFSYHCPFSVVGSPYVNAFARSVPNIPIVGLDSVEYHSVNARYGVMGTPTLLLFHNGNVAGRYNSSDYNTANLMSFINHFSDQNVNSINVTSSDFRANLPIKVTPPRPYVVWAAWLFLIACATWLFVTSTLFSHLTEAVLNNWREAEAQHDHQD
ncbi:thioredoxin domain-containing protein bug [Oratosquilla oratoria]|uniref:thioredoxin domain-containing protein bug n=1 Tax=Oratosquilla oratoria TaxID=337810 RepID=UPI003F75DE55